MFKCFIWYLDVIGPAQGCCENWPLIVQKFPLADSRCISIMLRLLCTAIYYNSIWWRNSNSTFLHSCVANPYCDAEVLKAWSTNQILHLTLQGVVDSQANRHCASAIFPINVLTRVSGQGRRFWFHKFLRGVFCKRERDIKSFLTLLTLQGKGSWRSHW